MRPGRGSEVLGMVFATYISVYIYVYICIYIYWYMRPGRGSEVLSMVFATYISVYTLHTHIRTCVHEHTLIHTYTLAVCPWFLQTPLTPHSFRRLFLLLPRALGTHTQTHTRARVHNHTCACMHACMYACMHAHSIHACLRIHACMSIHSCIYWTARARTHTHTKDANFSGENSASSGGAIAGWFGWCLHIHMFMYFHACFVCLCILYIRHSASSGGAIAGWFD